MPGATSCELLRDLDTYKMSLPRREYKSKQGMRANILYKFPYYVSKEDLATMVNRLETRSEPPARCMVHYSAGPSGCGKSASILPAFLESAKNPGGFTHYLYIACGNNDGNYVKFDEASLSTYYAERQGTAFMFECVKRLLNGERGRITIRVDDQPVVFTLEEMFCKYLNYRISNSC